MLMTSLSLNAQTTQEGDLNTNNQDSTVNSNNNTENKYVTNNGAGSGKGIPVTTAIAPVMQSAGNDTCLVSASAGIQVSMIGASGGGYIQDDECNRRKDARLLKEFGMSIAAISRMCQNEENWMAMFEAGSPCPILVDGKMIYGKRAIVVMRKTPDLYIPDYNEKNWYGKYVKRDYYNKILGIGVERDETSQTSTSDVSVSERFRSSVRPVRDDGDN